MGKRDYYQCPHCGYILPKQDATIYGYDSQSSLRHVHCPKCGKIITHIPKKPEDLKERKIIVERDKKMSKFQLFIDIISLVLTIIFSIRIGIMEISIEPQFIPTIINGLSSSVSLIVGFTVTAVIITISRQLFKPSQNKYRIVFTIVLLIQPIIILFFGYSHLMKAKYQLALKYAMISLIFSFFILFDFVAFLCSELEIMEQG